MNARQKKALDKVCETLRALQRQRVWYIGTKNKLLNRLRATVAASSGYRTDLTDSERSKMFSDAEKHIRTLVNIGKRDDSVLCRQILCAWPSIGIAEEAIEKYEKEMVALAGKLHIVEWVEHPDQKGFGLKSLACLIGESGNLYNYETPARLWKRMGCAPFEKKGEVLMPSTWRGKNGKATLSSEDWTTIGYSPRRRSVAYVFGENLVKSNGSGPYRARYDYVKEEYPEKHPDRVECGRCKGTKKIKGKNNGRQTKCTNCKGTGIVMMRAHRHAMLLATKLLLRNLWLEWWGSEAPTSAWDGHTQSVLYT